MEKPKFKTYFHKEPEPILEKKEDKEEPKQIKRIPKPTMRRPYRQPPTRNIIDDAKKPNQFMVWYSNPTGF